MQQMADAVAIMGAQLRPSLGDHADFMALDGEQVAALAREQAEHGFTESSASEK
jgi:hypothetical protein